MASRIIRKKSSSKPEPTPTAAPSSASAPATEKRPPSLGRRLLPAVLFIGFFLAMVVFFYDSTPQKNTIATKPTSVTAKKAENKASAQNEATKARYEEAKAEFAALRKDTSSDQEDFLEMAEEFYAIYTEDKTWINRPAALWRSAQALEVAADKERSEKYYHLALERYKRISTEYWKSVLADDALLQAAIVLAAKLDKPKEAQYLLSTIRNLYPKGDMIKRVGKLEQKLQKQFETRAEAEKKAQQKRKEQEAQRAVEKERVQDQNAETQQGQKTPQEAQAKAQAPTTPAQPKKEPSASQALQESKDSKAATHNLPPIEKIRITQTRKKWLLGPQEGAVAKLSASSSTPFAGLTSVQNTRSFAFMQAKQNPYTISPPKIIDVIQSWRAKPVTPARPSIDILHAQGQKGQENKKYRSPINPYIALHKLEARPLAASAPKPDPFVALYRPLFPPQSSPLVATKNTPASLEIEAQTQHTSQDALGFVDITLSGKKGHTSPASNFLATIQNDKQSNILLATPFDAMPSTDTPDISNTPNANDAPLTSTIARDSSNTTGVVRIAQDATFQDTTLQDVTSQNVTPQDVTHMTAPPPRPMIPLVPTATLTTKDNSIPNAQQEMMDIMKMQMGSADNTNHTGIVTYEALMAQHRALSQGKNPQATDAQRSIPSTSGTQQQQGQTQLSTKAPLPSAGHLNQRMDQAQTEDMAAQLGLSVRTVYIDIGHGGKDPGTSHNGIVEKEFVLELGKQLGAVLTEKGFTVIYSRTDNTFIPLSSRSDHANEAGADVFVSIHVNASPNRNTRGFETYYLDFAKNSEASHVATLENAVSDRKLGDLQNVLAEMLLNVRTDESKDLAQSIQSSAVGLAQTQGFATKDGGTRSAPFHVLIGTNMPAVLVEVGYCTNTQEAALLKNKAYRMLLAQGIGLGIVNYNQQILEKSKAHFALTE